MSTVPAVAESASVPAIPDEVVPGLEDFGQDDVVMPRITIDHPNGKFVNELTGEEYDALKCVPLGMVRQRSLWPPQMEAEKKPPLCRSLDGQFGSPDVERFPWKASGFARADYPGDNPSLSCKDCALKEWGTHPADGKKPWCGEQYVLPIMIQSGNGNLGPAILTLQGSAMTKAKRYLSAFATARQPTFENWLTLTLDIQKRGTVVYSTPSFKQGEATDKAAHADFAQRYYSIRAFLQTPFTREEEDAPEEAKAEAIPATARETDEIPF